jgi:hypothetical protein
MQIPPLTEVWNSISPHQIETHANHGGYDQYVGSLFEDHLGYLTFTALYSMSANPLYQNPRPNTTGNLTGRLRNEENKSRPERQVLLWLALDLAEKKRDSSMDESRRICHSLPGCHFAQIDSESVWKKVLQTPVKPGRYQHVTAA